MRKINVLKAIVDLLWIFSMPIVLLIVGFVIGIFFIDLSDLNLKINAVHLSSDINSKIIFAVAALNYLLIIAALYYFKKVLHHFLRVKIFEDEVINSFKKIGNLLSISGIISLITSSISKIYFEKKVAFEFGLNQHLVIICFGLFFLILSEIFKIAKNQKQENDLTI
jgi:hypothetical protein